MKTSSSRSKAKSSQNRTASKARRRSAKSRKPTPKATKQAAVQSTELVASEDEPTAVQSTEPETASLPFGHPDDEDNNGALARIRVEDIVANGRFRARGDLDIDSIARSLELNGQLQPVHVRKTTREDGTEGFELICGYRRHGGALALGWTHLSALVVEATDEQAAAMSLVENHARKTTSKTDVARGLLLLRETTGKKLEEVAEAHGRGKTQAFAYTAILKMPQALQDGIGDINHGCELEHAKLLHKAAKDGQWDDVMLSEWIARVDEGLSARELREKLKGAAAKNQSKKKLRERAKAYRATLGKISTKWFGNVKVLESTAGTLTEKQRKAEAKRCENAIAAIDQYRAALVGETKGAADDKPETGPSADGNTEARVETTGGEEKVESDSSTGSNLDADDAKLIDLMIDAAKKRSSTSSGPRRVGWCTGCRELNGPSASPSRSSTSTSRRRLRDERPTPLR